MWLGRCKRYLGLARVNLLLFLIPCHQMPEILSSNACKPTLVMGLLLVSYWTIHLSGAHNTLSLALNLLVQMEYDLKSF